MVIFTTILDTCRLRVPIWPARAARLRTVLPPQSPVVIAAVAQPDPALDTGARFGERDPAGREGGLRAARLANADRWRSPAPGPQVIEYPPQPGGHAPAIWAPAI